MVHHRWCAADEIIADACSMSGGSIRWRTVLKGIPKTPSNELSVQTPSQNDVALLGGGLRFNGCAQLGQEIVPKG